MGKQGALLYFTFLFLLGVPCFSQNASGAKTFVLSELKVTKEDESQILIKDLMSQNKILFYRINTVYCAPCVDRELTFLNKLSKQLPMKSIVVLTAFSSFRNYLAFARDHNKNLPIYNIQSLGQSIDNSRNEGSYYFNMSAGIQPYNIFFSDKQSPQSSMKYLKRASKQLFGVEPIL